MKRFIRDLKILKPEITDFSKIFLGGNAGVVIGYLITLPSPQDYIFNPLYFAFIINPMLIFAFLLKYFVIWRKEIQEAFNHYDLKSKYSYLSKRFGLK